MRRAKQIMAAGLVTILITTMMGGCTMARTPEQIMEGAGLTRAQRQAAIINQMTEHLEGKYGPVDFEVIRFEAAGFNQGYDSINAYPKGGDRDEDEFIVRREKQADGTYVFGDDYFGLLIRDEAREFYQGIADRYFENSKTFLLFGTALPNDLTASSTLQDYLAIDEEEQWRMGAVFIITDDAFANEEEFADAFDHYVQALRERKITRPFLRVFWSTSEIYETINTRRDVISALDRSNSFISELNIIP